MDLPYSLKWNTCCSKSYLERYCTFMSSSNPRILLNWVDRALLFLDALKLWKWLSDTQDVKLKVIFIVKNSNLLPFLSLQPSSNPIAFSALQLLPCSTFLFTLKTGQKSCQGLQLYYSVWGWVSILETTWVLLFQKCCHHSKFHFFIKPNAKDFFINNVSQ